MTRVISFGVLAGLLLSCSNNGVSTFGRVLTADITGMKYSFAGNGTVDSSRISGGDIPSVSYPNRLYMQCNPPDSIMVSFPGSIRTMKIGEDSMADYAGQRCSLLTYQNIMVLIYETMIPFNVRISGDCYMVGTSNSQEFKIDNGNPECKWAYIEHHSADSTRAFKMLDNSLRNTGLLTTNRSEILDSIVKVYQAPESLQVFADSLKYYGEYLIPKPGDTVYFWDIDIEYK